MNYKDINLEEPILSKEQTDSLAKRDNSSKAKNHPDLSEDLERAKKATGALFNVLGNLTKGTDNQSKPSNEGENSKDHQKYPALDSKTAEEALQAAQKVIPSKQTQEELKKKALEFGEDVKNVAIQAKDLIKDSVDVDAFSTDALALLFLALEATPPLLFLVINRILLILSIVLSFFILIAVAVIIVCYLIIKKYKDSLQGSTKAIVLEIVMSLTEGIIIVSFSIVGEDAFIAAYAILLVSLVCASILADNLKEKYSDTNGIRMAIIMVVNMVFVLFNVLNTNLIECGFAAAVTYFYLVFAISTLHEVVKELKAPNCKKSASFATLIVFERKVEIGYRSIAWIVRWVREMNEKRKAAGQSDEKNEKLLDKEQPKQEKPEKGPKDESMKITEKVEKPEKEKKVEKSTEKSEGDKKKDKNH
jgi:hypothetical protein